MGPKSLMTSKEKDSDSGAGRHMTPDESIFVNKRWISTIVTVANGEELKARLIGDARIDLCGRMINMKKCYVCHN